MHHYNQDCQKITFYCSIISATQEKPFGAKVDALEVHMNSIPHIK